MLDCYKLLLLSLSLTLSIIIIIIIISTINATLEEKEKATGWEGGFTNKTVWTCLYACYFYNSFLFVCLFVCLFVFWSFSCKNVFFFEFTILLVNLIKIKIQFIKKKKNGINEVFRAK